MRMTFTKITARKKFYEKSPNHRNQVIADIKKH